MAANNWTTGELGKIYLMDYSENLTGVPKYDPQAAHFNKSQYSLHCTVCIETSNEKPDYTYFNHFSNDNLLLRKKRFLIF